MKSESGKYWIIRLLSLLVVGVVVSLGFAQTQQEIKKIKFWEFDRGLIPAQHIYGTSWDSANVDSPRFDRTRLSYGFMLDLVEEGCDYTHPWDGVVTSPFGWRWKRMHKGIDIDLDIGDPVVAAFDGIIRIVKYNPGGYGNYVMIRHYNGLETLYAHLSESIVARNQTIRAGQIIGFGGSTGRSTGSHLHFETRFMGQAFNPAKIINFQEKYLKAHQFWINHTYFTHVPANLYGTKTNYTSSTSASASTSASSSTSTYHTVKKGDTLYAIARKHGTTVNNICTLNRISRSTTLRIGRRLKVK